MSILKRVNKPANDDFDDLNAVEEKKGDDTVTDESHETDKGMYDENKPILVLGMRRARLSDILFGVHFLAWCTIVYYRPYFGMCLAVLHACNIPMFVWWGRNQEINRDQIALHYVTGALPGLVVVYFFQYVFCIFLLGLHYGLKWYEFITRAQSEEWHPLDYFVLCLVCFFALALPEEAFKWWAVRSHAIERTVCKKEVMYFLGAVLGLANAQALVCVCMAYVVENQWTESSKIVAVLCVTVATPLHVISAYVVGLKGVLHTKFAKPQGFLSVVFPGFLARGLSLLSCVLFVFYGPYGGWLAFIPCGVMIFLYALYAMMIESHLPESYAVNVGYVGLSMSSPE